MDAEPSPEGTTREPGTVDLGEVLRFGAVIQAAAGVRRPLEDVLSRGGGEHLGRSHE
jgi:hypothetical protein